MSYDIDVVEPEAGSLPRLAVTGGDGANWYPLDWSPDDRKLLVLKYLSISEAYLYVVDLYTGQKREVDPTPAKVGIVGAKFSRDGQGVYLISNRDGEFAQLRYVNLFTAEKTVISGAIPWDIEELAISRDGHYLAYVSNEGGVDKLNLLDLKAHQDLIPPRLAAAGIIDSLSFDAEGSRLAFGFAAPNRPRDAYVLDIASNHLEAWTHSEAGAVDTAKFVTPRLTHFPTFDRVDGRQREIPLYVYEPTTPGPATTVIEVGVDVPEATIMVIEHAERFGLAQTHQLRGRVGRGAGRSTCLLLYKGPLGEAARARIQILRETEDGFRIAEEDLRLRGEGDVLGARQAGAPGFRLARLEVHGALLRLARAQAEAAVKRSERLAGEEFRGLRTLLYLFERDAAVRLLEAG